MSEEDVRIVKGILKRYSDINDIEDYDKELDRLEELLEEIRDYFDPDGLATWAWDAYGDEELRYYVIDENNICKYIIYPYRQDIIEVNEHICEVASYFAKDILKLKCEE